MAGGRPGDPLLRRRLDVGGGAWRQGEYDGAMRGLWFFAANVFYTFIYYYTFHTPHVYIYVNID
jgi:hypothetical protein